MNVCITPQLQAYMQKKGYEALALETCRARSCGGALLYVMVRGLDAKHVQECSDKAVRVLESAFCKVYVMVRGLEYEDQITFGIRNFLGVKDITVDGVVASCFV